MEQTLAKLVAELGFKFDDRDLLKFKIGFYGAMGLVTKFTADVVRATTSMDNFNKRTGIDPQATQQWQDVAKQSNVTAETITDSLETISRAKGDILMGQGNVSPWLLLGIDPRGDPLEVFDQVIAKLGEVRQEVRQQVIGQLGLDPQIVNLLGKSRSSSTISVQAPSEKERKSVLELGQAFSNLRITMGYVKDRFIASLEPVKIFLDLTRRMIEIVDKVITKFIGWEKFTSKLAFTFGAVWAVMHPVQTLIAGIALAIEDLWTYFEGGESVTGDLINYFKQFSFSLEGVWNVAKKVVAVFAGWELFKIGKKILQIGIQDNATGALKTVSSAVGNVASNAGKATSSIGKMINKVSTLMLAIEGAMLSYKVGKFAGEKLGEKLDQTETGQKIGDTLYKAWNFITGNKEDSSKLVNVTPAPSNIFSDNLRPNINPPATSSNNITNNNNNVFNIDGARDPQLVAQDIVDIQQQMNNAQLLFQ